MAVLVTGGAGYIGSHMVLSLLQEAYEVVVVDNFCNSSPEALRRVCSIAERECSVVEGDIRDEVLLDKVFKENDITEVLHFAGLKAVGESVSAPLKYYENNITGTLSLCRVMQRAGVRNLVFSSSATVYGDAKHMPISEDCPTGTPTNPYGRSKLIVEEILRDVAKSDPEWSIALLRYFNPVGAHESGLIGEDPMGEPNNLVPYVAQVAVGRRPQLSIFGGDYQTKDGTGVRDYIHVEDLVAGHLAAMKKLATEKGAKVWNLGTGHGSSVLEVVKAFQRVSGRDIAYTIVDRREGDIAVCWADPSNAKKELGWAATKSLNDMMADTWRWQSKNPDGYRS